MGEGIIALKPSIATLRPEPQARDPKNQTLNTAPQALGRKSHNSQKKDVKLQVPPSLRFRFRRVILPVQSSHVLYRYREATWKLKSKQGLVWGVILPGVCILVACGGSSTCLLYGGNCSESHGILEDNKPKRGPRAPGHELHHLKP